MTKDISFIELWGLYFPMIVTIMMSITWIVAFLSPNKEILIEVNRYGEAWIEMIIIPIAVIVAIVGQLKIYNRIMEDNE